MTDQLARAVSRGRDPRPLAHHRRAFVPDGIRRGWRNRVGPTAVSFSLALVAVWLSGCVERRMTIRTNVDNQGGALAIVDGRDVGQTPVSTGFTYYADREIRLIKDGYETLTVVQPVPAPWWDSLPLELVVENFLPWTLRDDREFQYVLPPAANVAANDVLGRAHQLRREGQLGGEIAPLGGPAPPVGRVGF